MRRSIGARLRAIAPTKFVDPRSNASGVGQPGPFDCRSLLWRAPHLDARCRHALAQSRGAATGSSAARAPRQASAVLRAAARRALTDPVAWRRRCRPRRRRRPHAHRLRCRRLGGCCAAPGQPLVQATAHGAAATPGQRRRPRARQPRRAGCARRSRHLAPFLPHAARPFQLAAPPGPPLHLALHVLCAC
eukprot:365786-Chlamydomonas_euryale.AAC.2